MVQLFCAIVGVAGSVFSVEVDEGKTVGDLKKAIKAKNEDVKDIDADKLQLFLAKKDEGCGAWLTEADVANGVSAHTTGLTPLKAVGALLKLVGLSEENVLCQVTEEDIAVGKGPVHVLVELPKPDEPRGSQLVGNPPALVAFWKAFLTVPTEVKADAVIALPEGTFLLGDPTLGARIYIRHCYPQLWEVCWTMIHDKTTNTPHFVVLGNPGNGKTFFGYAILLLLARIGATVVYESGISSKRFLFSRDRVVQGSPQDFVGILRQTTTFYIVDAVKPRYYPAKTILLTSPHSSVWYEFNKTNCQTCYMPVWSQQEIFKCRELMYSDIPVAVVQDCFRRWGGNARYVLRYAQVANQQAWLENAIAMVDPKWLTDACGKFDSDYAQLLLHHRVSNRFADEYFVFASQYVQQEVYKRLYVKDKQKLVDFISAPHGIGTLAVLRGHLFESHAHSVLPRGGTFGIRRLVDNGEAHDGVKYLTEGDWDEGEGEGDDDAMDKIAFANTN